MNVEGMFGGLAAALLVVGSLGTTGACCLAMVDEKWPKWGWLTLGAGLVGAGMAGAVS